MLKCENHLLEALLSNTGAFAPGDGQGDPVGSVNNPKNVLIVSFLLCEFQ